MLYSMSLKFINSFMSKIFNNIKLREGHSEWGEKEGK